MERYFERHTEELLRISLRDLMALGRKNANDHSEPFNMAYLAIRGSGAVNGVSRLQGAMSRRLFQILFPRWPETEVPVGHIANGSTFRPGIRQKPIRCGRRLAAKSAAVVPWSTWRSRSQVRCIKDVEIWKLRSAERRSLIEFAKERLTRERAPHGRIKRRSMKQGTSSMKII
jgi:starch phosphorylase